MLDNPLVSVIIPVYNCEFFIKKAIESILFQTYRNLEIIILNDASTDNSERKILEFNDPRIKYFSFKENSKKVGIVNFAFKIAKGDYIVFQDADDWSNENRIERQVFEFFSDSNLLICFTGYELVGTLRDGIIYRESDFLLKEEFHNKGFLNNSIYQPTVCATMMFKASVLKELKGYHDWFIGRMGEDMHLVYRILKLGKGKTISESLYFYDYNRAGSITNGNSIIRLWKTKYDFKALELIIDLDLQNGIDILGTCNEIELCKFEIKIFEEMLQQTFLQNEIQKKNYENSTSYKIGQIFVKSFKKFMIFLNFK